MKSKSILVRVAVLTLCIVMLLTGCLQRGSSNSGGNKVNLPDFDQIWGDEYIEVPNYNANNTGNNNNNNNTGNNNADDSSDDGASDEGPKEYKPVSSGTWKQERFYLSTCLCPTSYEGLKLLREAGFNLVEFGMEGDSAIETGLANVEKIDGLYALPSNEFRYTQNKNATFNDNSIRKVVYDYDKYTKIIGYNVWDEPTAGENNGNFKKAYSLKMLFEKWDPNSLKFVNMLPSYGIYTWADTDYSWEKGSYDGYIDTFISIYKPQVLALDYYPELMGALGDTSDWWRDLGLFRDRSLQQKIPFWYYYQGLGIAEGRPLVKNDTIYYQMYTGLAYGAKALSEWNAPGECYHGDDLSLYTSEELGRYNDAKARNSEIMAVGTYMLDKTSVELCHTGAADNYFRDFYITRLAKSEYIAETSSNSKLILSTFKDSSTNNKYLMVVNKNYSSAQSGTIKLKASANISKFNPATGNEDAIGTSDTISFDLQAGRGAVYILK